MDLKQINLMNQFMRIAMAILKTRYPYLPQRKAWAAKMYIKWQERKKSLCFTKKQKEQTNL